VSGIEGAFWNGFAAATSTVGAVAFVAGLALGGAYVAKHRPKPFDPTCKHRMELAPKYGWYGRRECRKCGGEV
jgi:hypothetical protein